MRTSVAIPVVTVGMLLAPLAAGETVIGRWCDRMLPHLPQYNGVLEIVIPDSGSAVMRERYGDGSSRVLELREKPGSVYEAVGAKFGDRYRIVPATGDLQLIDNEGLIRSASRLGNTPQPRECLR